MNENENQGQQAAPQQPATHVAQPTAETPAQRSAGGDGVQFDPEMVNAIVQGVAGAVVLARSNEQAEASDPTRVIGVIPEEQRDSEERQARVSGQRDIDGPEGVYVQTHRMFKHLAAKNTTRVHEVQDLMQRAGMYENASWGQYMGEQRAISLTSAEGAPFLPTTVDNRIEELREEFGAMRQVCSVFNFSSGQHKIPNVSGRPKVFAVNEGSDIKMRKATWGNVTLDPLKWGLLRSYSTEMNDEVGAQWVMKVQEQVGRAFAEAEDETVLIADGTAAYHSLTGILNNPSVTQFTLSASNSSFLNWTYDDGIDAMMLANAGNRSMGKHVVHPDFILVMAKFKDDAGNYLYQPNTLIERLIRDVITTEAMPSIEEDAATTNFHAFGDFSHVHMGFQRGIEVKLLDQATILDEDDSTQIRLGSMDGLALRFTARWDVKHALTGAFVRSRTAA